MMLRTLREDYDIEKYTANIITDDISLDLQPDEIRCVATGMIEKLQMVTYPGNPPSHIDDTNC